MRDKRLLPAAALAAVTALAARGHVFASRADEAVFVLLARSLRSGRFASAGGMGRSVADHLPGYPLLIALPSAVLEGRWDLYWLLALPFALAFAAGAWALARRMLDSEGGALACAALCGLSPAALELSGAALSDLPFAALAAWTLAGLRSAPLGLLGGGVALASLMRPQGAALALGAAAGAWALRGRRDGLLLAAAGLAPLGAWLLRTRLLVGQATEYVPQWTAQKAPPPLELLTALLGRAPFGLTGPAGAASGALLACAAAAGGLLLARTARRRDLAGPAVFAGLLVVMHASWGSVASRYALPLLPIVWPLAAASARRHLGPLLARVVWAALTAALAVGAWPLARAGLSGGGHVHAAAMGWLAANSRPDERVESLACSVVELIARRPASCPTAVLERDAWLGSLAERGVAFVHDFDFERDGYLPAEVERFALKRRGWALRWPGLRRVFTDEASGAAVYALKPGEGARLGKAWQAYERAVWLASQNEPSAKVRKALEDAARLAPDLALPYAGLGELETSPAKRVFWFEKALARDPSSAMIAGRLDGARKALAARPRP